MAEFAHDCTAVPRVSDIKDVVLNQRVEGTGANGGFLSLLEFVFQGQDTGDPIGFDEDEGVDEGVCDLGREGGGEGGGEGGREGANGESRAVPSFMRLRARCKDPKDTFLAFAFPLHFPYIFPPHVPQSHPSARAPEASQSSPLLSPPSYSSPSPPPLTLHAHQRLRHERGGGDWKPMKTERTIVRQPQCAGLQ